MGNHIYSKSGLPVGFHDGNHIYDLQGRAVGQLRGFRAFCMAGHYIGELRDGILLDKNCGDGSIGASADGMGDARRARNRLPKRL